MKCQTITRNNDVVNHTEAGDFLQHWLLEDNQFALLDGYGWLDGGCRILAHALVKVVPGANLKAIGKEQQRIPSDHVVVEIIVRGIPYYLDGDGVANEHELLEKMRVLESVSNPYIGEYDQKHLDQGGIIKDASLSKKLSAQLIKDNPEFVALTTSLKCKDNKTNNANLKTLRL